MYKLVLLFLATAICSSCVSKKRYTETLQTVSQQRDSIQQYADETHLQLNMQLAEKRGAIDALYTTQDKLQDRLDALQLQIDQLNQSSTNRQQDLSGQLSQQDVVIAQKQAQLAAIAALIAKEQSRLQTIVEEVKVSLPDLDNSQLNISTTKTYISLDLQEDVLFAKGSTSRLEEDGKQTLAVISGILKRYPEMMVDVIGHTDNRPINRQSLNNWQYTALRAVSVVEALAHEFDLGTNRVLAASKGEYQPRASNETSEARELNRRIEIRIQADRIGLIREIEKVLRS